MITETTRRGAIATMAAAATVAVTPAIALTPDPVVALASKCKSLLAEYVETARISSTLYDEVNGETEYLFGAMRAGDPGAHQRFHDEFDRWSEATGYGAAHAALDRISRRLRKSVNHLVGTRATTIRGVMAKLEVMSGVDHECGLPDLFEAHDEWLAIVRADLERIAGGES